MRKSTNKPTDLQPLPSGSGFQPFDTRREFLRAAAGAGAVMLAGGVLTACGGGADLGDTRQYPLGAVYGTDTGCPPTVWDLTAGQTLKVGSVTVSNDATNLYITYALNDDYPLACFGTLHIWVGNDPSLVPTSGGGPNDKCQPAPGQFCKAVGGRCYTPTESGLRAYTFTVPLSELSIVDITTLCNPPKQLYVFAHAEVDLDCTDTDTGHETAWGGPTPGVCQRWFFFGAYTVCCIIPPPPVDKCETAFAKGTHVFTTDKKSNPEKLPTLGLTRNRWGWAINLKATGTTVYAIYAGAGLNDISKGSLVGSLTVEWNGTIATVTYVLNEGCKMKEVHLYAGDSEPTTVAPGQYGNLAYFDPKQSSYTFEVPLADTNETGGVWLIAHAVVCCACSTC